jgi:hypothetical protein
MGRGTDGVASRQVRGAIVSGRPAAAFYSVCGAQYFLGAAAMINSLRLLGHTEPIYLLDFGLSPERRAFLGHEATIVPGPRDVPPWLLKTVAPLRHPADTAVLIDADMIVTRNLTPLLDRAAGGGVVAFRNDRDHFVAEWGELLDLGPVRRQPYVSSGVVVLGGAERAEVLHLIDDRQRRVDVERGIFGRRDMDYPFLFPDQDVLNAVLSARVEPDRLTVLDQRLAPIPPFKGLRIESEAELRLSHPDGEAPYVLHHIARKPWLAAIRSNVYSRLLTRLLLGDDVALRVDPGEIPLRLRTGPAARAVRFAVDYGVGGPSYVRRRLSGDHIGDAGNPDFKSRAHRGHRWR